MWTHPQPLVHQAVSSHLGRQVDTCILEGRVVMSVSTESCRVGHLILLGPWRGVLPSEIIRMWLGQDVGLSVRRGRGDRQHCLWGHVGSSVGEQCSGRGRCGEKGWDWTGEAGTACQRALVHVMSWSSEKKPKQEND
jgi:hypothetical protein